VTDELALYDYLLPDELIARHPPAQREDARLMVVDRAANTIGHRSIRDLPSLLNAGDCLMFNDSRVVPARLKGRRAKTGGKWEGLFLAVAPAGQWRLMCQTRGRLTAGEQIEIVSFHGPESATLRLTLVSRADEGTWIARPESDLPSFELLDQFGTVPLPPYVGRELPDGDDRDRYQTVYAQSPGSVAAPTAGLHFTRELLAECEAQGVSTGFVTLHVGVGTFRPIAVAKLDEHHMHYESCAISAQAVELVERTKVRGGRVVAVGTTTVRTLESAARSRTLLAGEYETNLFIRPPYEFRVPDALLTNFHLPRSTLLVLVSTFASPELIRRAYAEAIEQRYRFFSYGDAMLIE